MDPDHAAAQVWRVAAQDAHLRHEPSDAPDFRVGPALARSLRHRNNSQKFPLCFYLFSKQDCLRFTNLLKVKGLVILLL